MKRDAFCRVGIIRYERTAASALHGLVEFFHIANQLAKQVPIEEAARFEISVHDAATEFGETEGVDFDVIIVPPGQGEPMPDACPAALTRWLESSRDNGTLLCAACVGTYILAEAGVLDGLRATTHWMLADSFRARFPKVILVDDAIVVDSGSVLSAGATTAWLDLALQLAKRYGGSRLAMHLAGYFLIDSGGREQRFYRLFTPTITESDDVVGAVQRWIQQHYADPITLEDMAKLAKMSLRTFQRRFGEASDITPLVYLQHVRIGRACELLQGGDEPVEQVGWCVGYRDLPTFRRLFKRKLGLSPSAYRSKFRTYD